MNKLHVDVVLLFHNQGFTNNMN